MHWRTAKQTNLKERAMNEPGWCPRAMSPRVERASLERKSPAQLKQRRRSAPSARLTIKSHLPTEPYVHLVFDFESQRGLSRRRSKPNGIKWAQANIDACKTKTYYETLTVNLGEGFSIWSIVLIWSPAVGSIYGAAKEWRKTNLQMPSHLLYTCTKLAI